MLKFEVYKDAAYQYRWRLKASNGRIIADSAEGYVNRRDCEAMIDLIKIHVPSAQVVSLVA
jgi:uncharacterized protein YegP (UPF0339 family)